MKLLLTLLIATLLMAGSQHNFKIVSFYGKTLEDVALVLEDDNYTFSIYYQGIKLNEEFMIVSCARPEKFCIVRKQEQYYGEIR